MQAGTAVLGERVSMEIEVTGTPSPSISWKKDEQPVTDSSTDFRLISQGNCHKLVIDRGVYFFTQFHLNKILLKSSYSTFLLLLSIERYNT